MARLRRHGRIITYIPSDTAVPIHDVVDELAEGAGRVAGDCGGLGEEAPPMRRAPGT
jgi:hypothetical protein